MAKVYVASVSGGKDSTALCLHLREQGIPFRAVHFNTGWEHPDTYRYLTEVLPGAIGQDIEVRSREPELDERREEMAQELEALLGFRSPMVRWILSRGMFPNSRIRFCTQELKVFTCRDVIGEVHRAGDLPVNATGIRAAESPARAKLDEHELSTTLDCLVWRPLIRWSEREVIDIHHRHGVPPNPLYLRGATRVGCWPCINADKIGIRLVAKDAARVRVIERLEQLSNDLAEERATAKGVERPDKFDRTYFTTHEGAPIPIRKMIAWAQTRRGGKEIDRQTSLPGLNDGCLRWGMCDLGGRDGDP